MANSASTTADALRKHRARNHRDPSSYRYCKPCQAKFVSEKTYNTHMKKFHSKKQNSIDTTNTTQETTENLTNSSTTSSTTTSSSRKRKRSISEYKCTIEECGKIFNQQKELIYHLQRDHSIQEPYTCPFPGCGTTFAEKNYEYSNHMKIQHNGKPYKCEYCSKAYESQSKLNKHIPAHKKSKQHLEIEQDAQIGKDIMQEGEETSSSSENSTNQ